MESDDTKTIDTSNPVDQNQLNHDDVKLNENTDQNDDQNTIGHDIGDNANTSFNKPSQDIAEDESKQDCSFKNEDQQNDDISANQLEQEPDQDVGESKDSVDETKFEANESTVQTNDNQEDTISQQSEGDTSEKQSDESKTPSIEESTEKSDKESEQSKTEKTETTDSSNVKTYNIFVGDLRSNVTEQDLYDAFKDCGEIHSVHVIRDKLTGVQKGYGFVHFKTKEAREVALKPPYCNQDIKGRSCRVNLPDEKNTLWINNLPLELNEAQVKEELQKLLPSNIKLSNVELKTGPAPDYTSRGFAFVTFENHDLADQARKFFSKSSIKGRLLNVSWAEPKREVDESIMKTVKTLFVSNLHNAVTEEQLQGLFLQFGEIKNCTIVRDSHGDSKGFAFVEYFDRETCENSLKYLKGVTFCGLPLEIQFAKPPQEKESSKKSKSDSKSRGAQYSSQRQSRGGSQRQQGPTNGRMQQWGTVPTTQTYPQTVYPQSIPSVPALQALASAYTAQSALGHPNYGQQYYNSMYTQQYGQGVNYSQTHQTPNYYGQYQQGYTQPRPPYPTSQTTPNTQSYYQYYYQQPQQQGQQRYPQ